MKEPNHDGINEDVATISNPCSAKMRKILYRLFTSKYLTGLVQKVYLLHQRSHQWKMIMRPSTFHHVSKAQNRNELQDFQVPLQVNAQEVKTSSVEKKIKSEMLKIFSVLMSCKFVTRFQKRKNNSTQTIWDVQPPDMEKQPRNVT